MKVNTRRVGAAAALLVALTFGTAGCGSDGDAAEPAAAGEKSRPTGRSRSRQRLRPIRLTSSTSSTRPTTRTSRSSSGPGDLAEYTPQLTQKLAAGSGAGDVVAIEEGVMVQFKAKRRQLRQPAATTARNDLKGNFLPWKWEQGDHGRRQELIGLGTDVGGMAMCYRTRPVREGRPADRPRRGRPSCGRPGTTTSTSASSSRRKNTGAALPRRGDQHATTRS